jgi:hypothetical protein
MNNTRIIDGELLAVDQHEPGSGMESDHRFRARLQCFEELFAQDCFRNQHDRLIDARVWFDFQACLLNYAPCLRYLSPATMMVDWI